MYEHLCHRCGEEITGPFHHETDKCIENLRKRIDKLEELIQQKVEKWEVME